MFRSLRFRLPALFLAGVVLAGLVSTIIALGLFQSYVQQQSIAQLRHQSDSLTGAIQNSVGGDKKEAVPFELLRRGTGTRIYFVGLAKGFGGSLFPGQKNLPTLPKGQYYEMFLSRGVDQRAASCGTFRVAGSTDDIRLNVPYRLDKFNGWIVTREQPGSGKHPVVLTTA